jgi:hypothetical protein
MRALDGIRTRNPSKRAASDPRRIISYRTTNSLDLLVGPWLSGLFVVTDLQGFHFMAPRWPELCPEMV